MDLGLQDKIACVAGSTRGIGRVIAEALLREGACVAVSGRTASDLVRTREELAARWGLNRIVAFHGDLTREVEVRRFVETIRDRWQGLDVLICNVGSGRGQVGYDLDQVEWHRLLDLNLTGSAMMVRFAVPLMRGRGNGNIVFISSIAGLEALPAPVPYTCAKAGVVAFAKVLSRMLAAERIRVNVVAPGNIVFPGGVWAQKIEADADRVRAYIEAEVPMKRLGTPEEVAQAVLLLASDRASFITGVCLAVDGGQLRGW